MAHKISVSKQQYLIKMWPLKVQGRIKTDKALYLENKMTPWERYFRAFYLFNVESDSIKFIFICLKEKPQIGIHYILSLQFKGEFTGKVRNLTTESSIFQQFRSSTLSLWNICLGIVFEIQVISNWTCLRQFYYLKYGYDVTAITMTRAEHPEKTLSFPVFANYLQN